MILAQAADDRALMRALLEQFNVSVTDSVGRFLEVNEKFCTLSGYSRDELIGQPYSILNSGTHEPEFWANLWTAIAGGESWSGDICDLAKDGSRHWTHCIIAPFIRQDGRDTRYLSIRTDVTSAHQNETSLLDERRFMASLLNTLPDEVSFKDCEGRFLRINPTLARKYSLADPTDAVGKSVADYHVPKDALRNAAVDRLVVSSGVPVINSEEQEFWPNRPPRWQLVTKMPVRNGIGGIVGTMGISHDITLRKNVTAQLQDTNERFALAAQSAGVGIWEMDVATGLVIWDDWMYRIFGIARIGPSVPLAQWEASLHPDDRARCLSEYQDFYKGPDDFASEFRIVRPDGDVRYVKATGRASRAPDGTALRMTGVNFDVTERKRAELALLETSSLLRTVLDSVADTSIIATGPDLIIRVFNAGAERMLGYKSEEMVGLETPMRVHDWGQVQTQASELSMRVGRPIIGWAVFIDPSKLNVLQECTYVCKSGRRFTVAQMVTAMRSQDGQVLGYLSVAHDITKQQLFEESLREAKLKAEQANRAKSAFLANMSHEIRTPLNAVIGLTYLLGQTNLNPQQTTFLGNINVAGKTLLSLINDVLDLSKIEAGELIIERATFSPRQLLQELADVMGVQANGKNIALTVVIPDNIPEKLEGDSKHLNQILTNLLSNAIRFTDQGSVNLRVALLDSAANSVSLCFSVEDSGIGIAPEAQARLFSPFAQADASITRRFGGTGLGLSIVKSLTNLLGGDVTLQSTPNVGSVFRVILTFALARAESQTDRPPDPPEIGERGLSGIRVLVVDDSDINRDVTKRILELHGAAVSLACNGLEAFELLRAQPKDWDVVLMDVQMPILDGHAATRRIRMELGLAKLPIIALTAGALSSEHQRAAAAGMNDFIVKPFDRQVLARSILRHVDFGSTVMTGSVRTLLTERPANQWPVIEGIDSNEARLRMSGDLDLFHASLKRLFAEFSTSKPPAATADADTLASCAARMHKLKGIAGILGAKQIQIHAHEAEAACLEGAGDIAAQLMSALAAELEALRAKAAATLNAAQEQADLAALACNDALDPREIEELVALLKRQDLAALDRFNSKLPQLQRHMGKPMFEVVRDHIDHLRFTDAAELLTAFPQ